MYNPVLFILKEDGKFIRCLRTVIDCHLLVREGHYRTISQIRASVLLDFAAWAE